MCGQNSCQNLYHGSLLVRQLLVRQLLVRQLFGYREFENCKLDDGRVPVQSSFGDERRFAMCKET